MCTTNYVAKILYYKWIINDAKQVLLVAAEVVKSSQFELQGIGKFYLSAEWKNRNIKITLYLPNRAAFWISDIEFCISDCPSERVVQTDAKKVKLESESCTGLVSIPQSERLDNYLKDGNLTIEVRATVTLLTNPVQGIAESVPVPEDKLRESINDLFLEQCFTDVSIEVGEKKFKAHKVILASQSDVFRRMFETDMKEKNECLVRIQDISPEVMEDLLSYFYTGLPKNSATLARELLVAANKYNVSRLQIMCENELMMNLTSENVTPTLILADKLQQTGNSLLKKECIKFIRNNAKSVMKSTTWNQCEDEITKDILIEIAMKD